MSSANQYIREVLHQVEQPPPVQARFFYTSPLAIDDSLSPLPPPATGTAAPSKQPPRPFSEYDNAALDKAWLELRRNILQYNEEQGEKSGALGSGNEEGNKAEIQSGKGKQASLGREGSLQRKARRNTADDTIGTRNDSLTSGIDPQRHGHTLGTREQIKMNGALQADLQALDISTMLPEPDVTTTTGTPFIRAPSRSQVKQSSLKEKSQTSRPQPLTRDTYQWGSAEGIQGVHDQPSEPKRHSSGPSAKVAVGISRLHNVVMPSLDMEPIYWSPVHDISAVVRGTWFYRDTMLPVETPVANMLEAGYTELQPWTETWQDELNSAIEVGAAGEMKILRMLWPEPVDPRQSGSRPGTVRGEMTGIVASRLVI